MKSVRAARRASIGVAAALVFSMIVAPQRASAAPSGASGPAPAAAAPAPPAALPQPAAASEETLRAVAKLAGVGVEDVRPTPVPKMFEIRHGADVVYMTQDGQYLFNGDLYVVASHDDLTEARRSELRRSLIDAVPESDMVVFSPPQPKYTVTVFTDVDCSYCRALHRQIAEYNRLGVRVRYMFYPRSGPNTESWFKAEQVWCSADRKAALTEAKLGQPLQAKRCANTPVLREWELGKAIGLQGTPGIVASNGTLVGGYLPPAELVEELKKLQP